MSTTPNNLFRKESLERLASPEKLDQLMQVVSLSDWVPLGALGVMVGAVLMWSIVGRVPVNVQGRGAFVDPASALGAEAQVVDFEAPGTGPLLSLKVRRGDRIKKGDVLGVIDQPELVKMIEIEKIKLGELLEREHLLGSVRGQKTNLDRSSLSIQRKSLNAQLVHARELTPLLKAKNQGATEQARRDLRQRLRSTESQMQELKVALDAKEELRKKGLIPEGAYMAAKHEYMGADDQASNIKVQMRELDTREVENQRAYVGNLTQIAELEGQLQSLDVRSRTLDLDTLNTSQDNHAIKSDIQNRINQLETQLRGRTEIRSEVSGRVVEVTGIIGQMVQRGQRLGNVTVEAADGTGGKELSTVAYFTIGDGKRITPGMKVQVTPDTVKREEYGGILGTVTRVSEFPITRAGATNVINSDEVAGELIANGHTIEVFTKLEADPNNPSGYKWSSSKGPRLKLTLGTTASVRVAVEERQPISYLLPILRTATGSL